MAATSVEKRIEEANDLIDRVMRSLAEIKGRIVQYREGNPEIYDHEKLSEQQPANGTIPYDHNRRLENSEKPGNSSRECLQSDNAKKMSCESQGTFEDDVITTNHQSPSEPATEQSSSKTQRSTERSKSPGSKQKLTRRRSSSSSGRSSKDISEILSAKPVSSADRQKPMERSSSSDRTTKATTRIQNAEPTCASDTQKSIERPKSLEMMPEPTDVIPCAGHSSCSANQPKFAERRKSSESTTKTIRSIRCADNESGICGVKIIIDVPRADSAHSDNTHISTKSPKSSSTAAKSRDVSSVNSTFSPRSQPNEIPCICPKCPFDSGGFEEIPSDTSPESPEESSEMTTGNDSPSAMSESETESVSEKQPTQTAVPLQSEEPEIIKQYRELDRPKTRRACKRDSTGTLTAECPNVNCQSCGKLLFL